MAVAHGNARTGVLVALAAAAAIGTVAGVVLRPPAALPTLKERLALVQFGAEGAGLEFTDDLDIRDAATRGPVGKHGTCGGNLRLVPQPAGQGDVLVCDRCYLRLHLDAEGVATTGDLVDRLLRDGVR